MKKSLYLPLPYIPKEITDKVIELQNNGYETLILEINTIEYMVSPYSFLIQEITKDYNKSLCRIISKAPQDKLDHYFHEILKKYSNIFLLSILGKKFPPNNFMTLNIEQIYYNPLTKHVISFNGNLENVNSIDLKSTKYMRLYTRYYKDNIIYVVKRILYLHSRYEKFGFKISKRTLNMLKKNKVVDNMSKYEWNKLISYIIYTNPYYLFFLYDNDLDYLGLLHKATDRYSLKMGMKYLQKFLYLKEKLANIVWHINYLADEDISEKMNFLILLSHFNNSNIEQKCEFLCLDKLSAKRLYLSLEFKKDLDRHIITKDYLIDLILNHQFENTYDNEIDTLSSLMSAIIIYFIEKYYIDNPSKMDDTNDLSYLLYYDKNDEIETKDFLTSIMEGNLVYNVKFLQITREELMNLGVDFFDLNSTLKKILEKVLYKEINNDKDEIINYVTQYII